MVKVITMTRMIIMYSHHDSNYNNNENHNNHHHNSSNNDNHNDNGMLLINNEVASLLVFFSCKHTLPETHSSDCRGSYATPFSKDVLLMEVFTTGPITQPRLLPLLNQKHCLSEIHV